MKPSWGVGALVAVLVSVAVYLFGILDIEHSVSLILLLVGLWTLVAAFVIEDQKDRSYYSGWGVVIAFLSLFAFIPLNYTFGLIILAVVALIVLTVYVGRTPKVIAEATTSPPPAGGTPRSKAA